MQILTNTYRALLKEAVMTRPLFQKYATGIKFKKSK